MQTVNGQGQRVVLTGCDRHAIALPDTEPAFGDVGHRDAAAGDLVLMGQDVALGPRLLAPAELDVHRSRSGAMIAFLTVAIVSPRRSMATVSRAHQPLLQLDELGAVPVAAGGRAGRRQARAHQRQHARGGDQEGEDASAPAPTGERPWTVGEGGGVTSQPFGVWRQGLCSPLVDFGHDAHGAGEKPGVQATARPTLGAVPAISASRLRWADTPTVLAATAVVTGSRWATRSGRARRLASSVSWARSGWPLPKAQRVRAHHAKKACSSRSYPMAWSRVKSSGRLVQSCGSTAPSSASARTRLGEQGRVRGAEHGAVRQAQVGELVVTERGTDAVQVAAVASVVRYGSSWPLRAWQEVVNCW